MAYGLKYAIQYETIHGVQQRLEMYRADYVGPVIPLTGIGEVVRITYKDSSRIDDEISTSNATLSLLETGSFKYSDVFTSDERSFKVMYKVGGELKWSGWMLPEFGNKNYKGSTTVELSATDSLSTLKNIQYARLDGEFYYGRQSLLEVVKNCLAFTDLELDIHLHNDLSCLEWSDAPSNDVNNVLSATYVHSERFKDGEGGFMNCFDILKNIMTMISSTLRQEDGHWSIFNWMQRAQQVGFIHRYLPDGMYQGTDPIVPSKQQVGAGIGKSDIVNISEEITPVFYNTEVFSEHGPYLSLVKNTEFQNYRFPTSSYDDWEAVGGIVVEPTPNEVSQYNGNGTVHRYRNTGMHPPRIVSEYVGPISTGPHLRSSPFSLLQGEKLNIKMGLVGFPDDRLVITVEAGGYFLHDDGQWITGGSNSNGVIFKLPNRRPPSGPISQVSQRFEITTSEHPSGATNAEFRIYGHRDGGDPNRYEMNILSLEISKEEGNVKLSKGIIFSTVNAGTYSYVPEQKLTIFSDYVASGISYFKNVDRVRPPAIANSTVSNIVGNLSSTLKNRDDEPTENWNRFEVEEEAYLNLIATRSIALAYGKVSKVFSADIINPEFNVATAFEFDAHENQVFLFTGGSFNSRSGVISGRWAMINLEQGPIDEAVYSKFNDSSDKGSGVTGNSSSGTGGSGPSQSLVFANKTTLDKISVEDVYLMYNSEKINAGNSDKLEGKTLDEVISDVPLPDQDLDTTSSVNFEKITANKIDIATEIKSGGQLGKTETRTINGENLVFVNGIYTGNGG